MGAGVAGTDRLYRAAAVVALGSAAAALVVMCAAVRVHPWSMLGLHVLTHRPGALLVAMLLFGFSMASARFALLPAGRRPRRGSRRHGAPVTGAGRAVLLLNPRSGSGKAARLDLAGLARRSGADIVPVGPVTC